MIRYLRKIKNSEYTMVMKERLLPSLFSASDAYPAAQIEKAMGRFKTCALPKKRAQIKKEIRSYKKFWNCYPYDYFLSDLYREDEHLSEDELLNYIPAFFWYYLFLPHHTSYENASLINNKILTEFLFRGLNVAQASTLGMVIHGTLYNSNASTTTFTKIMQTIQEKNPEKLFVKPADGTGGFGLYMFTRTDTGQYSTPENVIFNQDFLSMMGKPGDCIIQEGIIQDPEFSKIYPDSVNTCRIVTENFDGNVRPVCAMMRFGRGGLNVDNVSSGGLCLKIDIRNGKVGEYAVSYEHEKFSEHPDTGFSFKNFKISRWKEIVDFVNKSAEKLPYFSHLGWDICLTKEGPLAIEANLDNGIEVLQLAYGRGLRKEFGIEDPGFYWKNPGKRL